MSSLFPVFLQTALPGNLLSGLLQKEPIKLLNGYSRCPFCPREMKKKDNMIKHIRIHTGEKPHQCSFCSYACSDKSSLIRHVKSCPNRILPLPAPGTDPALGPGPGPAQGPSQEPMIDPMSCLSVEQNFPAGPGQIIQEPVMIDPMSCVKIEESESSNTPLAALYAMQSDQS